jgi:hypothetical protein
MIGACAVMSVSHGGEDVHVGLLGCKAVYSYTPTLRRDILSPY